MDRALVKNRFFWLFKCIVILGLSTACDDSDSDPLACSANDLCAPGYRCVDQVCEPCEGSECESSMPIGVGPNGGKVCLEAEGICLEIPADALDNYVDISIKKTEQTLEQADLVSISPIFEISPTDQMFRNYASLQMAFSADTELSDVSVWFRNSSDAEWMELSSDYEANELSSAQVRNLGYFVAAHASRAAVDAGLLDASDEIDTGMVDAGMPSVDTGPSAIDTGVTWPDALPFDSGFDAGSSMDAMLMVDGGPIDMDASGSADADPPVSLDAAAPDATAMPDATSADASPDATVATDASMADLGGVILGQDSGTNDGSTSGSDASNPPLGNQDATTQTSMDASPMDASVDASTDASQLDGSGGPSQTVDSGGPPP